MYEFTFDDSATGRVKVPADPGAPDKDYEVQTYTAKRDGTSITDAFVKFYPAGAIYGFFMELEDYKPRVGGDKTTYKADWDQYDKDGKLSCDLWDDDGKLIGQGGGTRSVPNSLIPRKGRSTNDDIRLKAQVNIWRSIARDQASASRSGRLWKSHVPMNPPLNVFIVANEQFLTKDDLEGCIKDVNMTELNTWLKLTFLTQKDLAARKDLLCVSENLLRIYDTYMTKTDLGRLITAQTTGKKVEKDWMRAFLTTTQAEDFNKSMIDTGKYKGTFHAQTTTALTGARPKEERVDTSSIMGQSANVVSCIPS
ncbi:hypothetical protein MPER_09501 [Moniliophthora perniciosa FA553]|nr:hypothetical protein MPER_09501 [Moniliophthora perniciosa FA553]